MLSIERKRSDRSGRRFVLVLLHTEELTRTMSICFRTSCTSSYVLIRETDVKGWYKHEAVFGIIFTEIGDVDGTTITAVLLNKVTRALAVASASTRSSLFICLSMCILTTIPNGRNVPPTLI